MCTKFQINQVIVTLFSGVWNKNPTPVVDKVVKCRKAIGLSEIAMRDSCRQVIDQLFYAN